MRNAENVNAPWLGGWVIGAAAGLVAMAVLVVVGKFDLFPAAAIGAVVALVVGLILGLPWGAGSPALSKAVVDAAPQRPVAEAMPAAFVAAPAMAPVAETAVPFMATPATAPASKPKAAAKPKAKATPATPEKAKAAAKPKAEATPDATAKPKAAAKPKVAKPAGLVRLKAPRKGGSDDLKEIEGIGPALEKLVNELGFYHFDQIASWSDADVALVDAEMKTFKGRITRDKWVAQARIIMTEGLAAFRERAKTNNY
jgi:predicted flap endonuclease-1-like 5' DNA nuclease